MPSGGGERKAEESEDPSRSYNRCLQMYKGSSKACSSILSPRRSHGLCRLGRLEQPVTLQRAARDGLHIYI